VYRLAGAFDGSLASAQSLASAVQAQYALELQLVAQIQNALSSTQAMFGNSIEQIQMSVMNDEQRYDYLRTKVDDLYVQLATATDPAAISDLAKQINDLTLASYNLLDDTQQATVADEFVDYLEGVRDLTTTQLEASQAQITATHEALAENIESVMMAVADRMMQAANTPVSLDVNVDVNTPANVEVGYGVVQLA
jgi:predicted  nucleic acid-binding Zn-ribbon protein